MVDYRDKIRVGSTPTLRYTIKDGDDELDLTLATLLEGKLVPPSGGSASSPTPVAISGETAVVDIVTTTSSFDVAGEWEVAVRVTFPGSKVYETTVDRIHVDESQF